MGDFRPYKVYAHYNNEGLFYVGATRKKYRPTTSYGRSEKWQNAAKNGWNTVIVAEGLTKQDASELEELAVRTWKPQLSNIRDGGLFGSSFTHTEETKRYISKIQQGRHKGVENPFFGKKHTKESLKIISEKQCKKVINLDGGKIYKSAKEASEKLGYAQSTLTKYLNGTTKNKTNLKYYE